MGAVLGFLSSFLTLGWSQDCPTGQFGWECRYTCNCHAACDRATGECDGGCPGTSWGPGCLLDSHCTYNDPYVLHYEGRITLTGHDTCVRWDSYAGIRYKKEDFPGNSLTRNVNYCRNPIAPLNRAEITQRNRVWCYINKPARYGYCTEEGVPRECSCPSGLFGTNCKSECHCNNHENICHNVTGQCPDGCHPNFSGVDCQVCAEGKYGPYCKDRCSDGCIGRCNNITGNCVQCKYRRYGDKCNERCHQNCDGSCEKRTGYCRSCKKGFYGNTCGESCPAHCNDNTCVQETGVCTSCTTGYYGDNCDRECPANCTAQDGCDQANGYCVTCRAGSFGWQCRRSCPARCRETCNKDRGTCNGCKRGYFGGTCDRRCHCVGSCDQESGYCRNCVSGFHGSSCDTKCPTHCQDSCKKNNGDCNGCKPGYFGNRCEKRCHCDGDTCTQNNVYCRQCITGFYGYSCDMACHGNCQGGCEKSHGRCHDCVSGYYGTKCEQKCNPLCKDSCLQNNGECLACKSGQYGAYCGNPCPSECTGGVCDKEDGQCTYCNHGRYGSRCENTCPVNCKGDVCGRTSGDCDGCKPGNYGTKCNVKCSENCIEKTCSQSDGACNECKTGFYGLGCESQCTSNCLGEGCIKETGTCIDCLHGTFGKYCQRECPTGCEDRSCLKESGQCQTCVRGYYGPFCTKNCPAGCDGGCRMNNASCLSCKVGLKGTRCEEVIGGSPGSTVGAVFGVLLVILLILLVLFLLYRRRKTNGQKASPMVNMRSVNQNNDYVFPEYLGPAGHGDDAGDVYDDTGVMYDKAAIPVAMLPGYVRYMLQKEGGFEDEYKSIPTDPNRECTIGKMKELQAKNRFKNIIPYDDNRVVISPVNNDPLSDYINASYISSFDRLKEFIAAQGPNPSSLNDFLQMLWEYNVPLVVMVTSLKEDKKTKCEKYWPNPRQTSTYGEIFITLRNSTVYPYYVLRKLVLKKGDMKKEVTQLQFTKWPDHGVPQSASAFLAFHRRACEFYDVTRGPTVVHCSAGVGRTGTFLAMDYLLRRAAAEGTVSVYNCVKELRKYRVNMVQSLDQYKFIHESLLVALHCGATLHEASGFENWNIEDHRDSLKTQFQVLDRLSPKPSPGAYSASQEPANVSKNRSRVRVPTNQARPWLMTPVPHGNDYINAVFLKQNAQKKDGVVVTQSPMTNTIVDFWRLVYDYNCTIVVALNSTGTPDLPEYLPATACKYGPFQVKMTSVATEDNFIRKWIRYQHKAEEERVLHHFAIHPREHGKRLPDPAVFLSLIDTVNVVHAADQEGRILIHCEYGFEHSGLFCALSQIIHKITSEQEIDVFSAVKQIRNNRPEFIPSLADYHWLHGAALEFVKSFSTYANFR